MFNSYLKSNERHFTELLRMWDYLVRYSKKIKKMSLKEEITNYRKKNKLYKKGYIIMLLDAKICYMLYICSQNYGNTEHQFNRYLRHNFIEKMVEKKEGL